MIMDHVKVTATLRDWRKHIVERDGSYVYWGHIYDDTLNRFPNGHFIHTSRVLRVEGDYVYTDSSIYRLEGDAIGPEFETPMKYRDQP